MATPISLVFLSPTHQVGGGLNHDELVVYKNEAAIPSYLIVYALP